MSNIKLINGLRRPKKISAKYFLSVEISRPKVKKMEAVNPYITPLRGWSEFPDPIFRKSGGLAN